MKTTHHSEYLKLQSVFVKTVKNGFISQDKLNKQWQALNYLEKPSFDNAILEYGAFLELFQHSDIELKYFPQDNSVKIDSIYCRDASIATDFGMIICNMGKSGRVNEPDTQMQTYVNEVIPILGIIEAPGTLEGGDVAWLDEKTLAVGHTYRTNVEGIKQLKNMLEPKGVEVLVVELPHYKGA